MRFLKGKVMYMNAIEIKNLHKSYGSNEVLKGIDLEVKKGSLLALLGPNGAGKTTIVNILATLASFGQGEIKVFGHDVVKEASAVRKRISLTGQFASVDEELTGRENLILIARLSGYGWRDSKKRADELLAAFEIEDAANRLAKNYSGGMKRRLDLAASIVVPPDLLFLDEPTTGLDPRSRRAIWDTIRTLKKAGTTILLTTQYLEEADELAERIVIIDRGSIIADGTAGELKNSLGSGLLTIRLNNPEDRDSSHKIIFNSTGLQAKQEQDPRVLTLQVSKQTTVTQIITHLDQSNIAISEFSLGQPSLDEVFLTLTGKDTRQKQEVA
jgi:ABC-2 type transport system ATP-binding protein